MNMIQHNNSFIIILPEILLLSLTLLAVIVDLFKKNSLIIYLTSITILIILIISSSVIQYFEVNGQIFGGSFLVDNFSQYFKILLFFITMFSFVYSRKYVIDFNILSNGNEFYYLTLFSLLGQMIMVSAGSFLTVYLGLELMSLPLYTMIAMRRDFSVSIEAALKYFILGSIASAILLYGFSFIYGLSNSLEINDISKLFYDTAETKIILFALIFIIVGLVFKLGLVPFHMWVPDVYQGSPTVVTLLISTGPKIAVFAVMVRLLFNCFLSLSHDWYCIIVVLSALSLFVGNVAAILQSNFKRILAYSAISHMGFVLLGLISNQNIDGSLQYADSIFYIVSYVLTNLLIFGLLMYFSHNNFDCENLDDLKGLNQINPIMSFMILISMLSLAGLPPFVGFYAKFAILKNLIDSSYIYIAIYAVLCSLIGVFYYLRVIKIVYFDKREDLSMLSTIKNKNINNILLILNGSIILIISIFPDVLFNLCMRMSII